MKAARGRTSGFTLIEVMLTIALIALMTSMFVLNLNSLLRESGIRTLENEYWRAVDSARTKAVFNQKAYLVEWNPKENSFVVSSSGDTESFDFDSSEFGDAEVEVIFEEKAPQNSYILIRGQLVTQREATAVHFYPDGTCTPFTVSMKVGPDATRFEMDPWTGAQLVEPTENEI